MAQARRSVKHYQADNGRSADNGFVDAVNSKSQKLTFCGVGAHHQNSIIENKNKVLTTGAQKILLHGIRVASNDRQHDLAILNEIYIRTAKQFKVHILERTPESILHGAVVRDIPASSYHTLFCPTYGIDARLQRDGGADPPKWEPHSRIGV